jgi:hypothetical protein
MEFNYSAVDLITVGGVGDDRRFWGEIGWEICGGKLMRSNNFGELFYGIESKAI